MRGLYNSVLMGLQLLEIVMDLEDFFQVRIPDDAASACVTVADLQAEIVKLLLLKAPRADPEQTRRTVWDDMMKVLARNGYNVSRIRPESKWIGDVTENG